MAGFSKGEAIGYGWGVMKEKFWFFLVTLVIVVAVDAPLSLISAHLQDNLHGVSLIFYIIINIVYAIISLWISLGVIRICLNLYETKAVSYADLFSCSGSLIWKYFLSSLLASLIVLAGTILLIIPGIYLALRLQFINYLIVEEGLGPVAAIDSSWKITSGHAWNLFLLSLILILINLAGLICLVFGLLATYPTTLMANTFVYKWLKQSYESQQPPALTD